MKKKLAIPWQMLYYDEQLRQEKYMLEEFFNLHMLHKIRYPFKQNTFKKYNNLCEMRWDFVPRKFKGYYWKKL